MSTTDLQLQRLINESPFMLTRCSRDLRFVFASRAYAAMLGRTPADVEGRSIVEVLGAEALAAIRPYVDRVLGGERVEFESDVRLAGVGTRSLRVVYMPDREGDGPIAGWLAAILDVTDHRNAQEVRALVSSIVESSFDAIVTKDLNGLVTSWNAAAEQLFGYTAAEMIGQPIRRVIPAERQVEADDILARLRRGERIEHFETVRIAKGGRPIEISVTISPLRNVAGTIVGASKIARDITTLKASEAERLRLVQENAAITQALNEVGALVASDLDREKVVQAVIDAAIELTSAQFGVFGPTFKGTGVVRSDDITTDPRYGHNASYHGMPEGHLPVRSYLAVPVRGREDEVTGGLFFGHPEPGRFTENHERLAVGIASWAAVALENARMYSAIREASQIKDDFLASLSHELRTPLSAILGYARILKLGIVPSDQREQAVDAIERNAKSLAQIVEDVLDISRIVSGKIRLDVQPVDLPSVVRHAIDAVMPAADAKGVRVEPVVDPQAGPISGDPERLQQVLWNLLSNAVKFTDRAGKVQVRLERVNSHVEVVVSDTGIGIRPEFLPHVFERFRQADSGIAREKGGLGLGLSIARQLAEMHGGTIEASSAGAGLGATFRVKLPVMIAHQLPQEPERVHPKISLAAAAYPRNDLRDIHVLAVDDDPDALAVVSKFLEAAGARVTTAGSAADAIRHLDRDVPQVLVADLGMPHVDGFQLIDQVRRHANPQVRRLPAAALTAYARSEDRVKALRAGFQIHLAKPIDPAELVTTIAALANRFAVEP